MQTLAVVPIFMGAGAAVLPTVIGVFASVGAVLMKPRELAGLVRRRPVASGVGVLTTGAVVAATWLGISAWSRSAAASARVGTDWAKVARAIQAREGAGGVTTAASQVGGAAVELVIGRGYTRTGADEGAAPMHLKELWKFSPEDTMFVGAPVVTGLNGGRIYAGAAVAGLGKYNGALECLDANTGKQVWEATDAKGHDLHALFSSPALTADGKYVIVGQGLHEDANCSLLCFDAGSGELKWTMATPLHLESSPAIRGDVVAIGAGAIEGPDGAATGNPGEVIAVQISTGKELWRVRVNDPESSPAMDEAGNVYIGSGFNGEAVVALAAATGKQLWRTPMGLPITGPITLDGDLVLAGGGNSDVVHSAPNAKGLVVALDRATGKQKWRTDFADAVLGGIAAREGVLICPVRTGEIVALKEADGSVMWRTRISGNSPAIAGTAFAGGKVYGVSADGYLAVIDAANGKILEKTFLNDAGKPGTGLCVGDPQVVGGRLIVGSETGGLHVYVGGKP